MFELHKLIEKTFSLSILDDQKKCYLPPSKQQQQQHSSSNHARPLLKNWSKMKIVKKMKIVTKFWR